METSLSERIRLIISKVPPGKVATYGQIAKLAGNPKAARAVSWVLHSSSRKYKLPWHRIMGAKGKISLPWNSGGQKQARLLQSENILPWKKGHYHLEKYSWKL